MIQKYFYYFIILLSFNFIKPQIDYLDTTFGNNGIVINQIGSNAKINSLTTTSDGSIFAVGTAMINNVQNLVLAKYNANGTFNNNFGVNGIVIVAAGTSVVGNAIAIDANNNIVVAGTVIVNSQNNLFIARYLPDGSSDLDFGAGGQVIQLIGSSVVGNSIAIDLNDNILVAGTATISGQANLYISRYLNDGIPDNSFGTSGIIIATGDNGYTVNALQIDLGSKIVLGGYTNVTTGTNLLLGHFNYDGSPDNYFGTNGIVTTTITDYPSSGINAIVINSTNIMVTGFAGNGTNNNFMTARYNFAGNLDATFGLTNTGTQINSIGNNSQGSAILAYNNGQIIALGFSDTNLATLKYNMNGSLDNTFGINGVLLTPILNFTQANSLVFQPLDGKVVAGGFAANGQNDFVLVKYNNNNTDFINITSISGTVVNTKMPVVSGASSLPNAQVNVYVNGVFCNTVSTNQFGNWNAGNTDVLPLGNNNIRVDLIQNSQVLISEQVNIIVADNLNEDSVFAYNYQNQTSTTATYSALPFDNTIRLGSWSYAGSNFTCNKTGTYFIEYNGTAGIISSSSILATAVNVGAMIAINDIEYVGSETNTNLDLITNQTRGLSKSIIVNLNAGDVVTLNYAVNILGDNNGFTAGLIAYRDYLNSFPSYSLSIIRIG